MPSIAIGNLCVEADQPLYPIAGAFFSGGNAPKARLDMTFDDSTTSHAFIRILENCRVLKMLSVKVSRLPKTQSQDPLIHENVARDVMKARG